MSNAMLAKECFMRRNMTKIVVKKLRPLFKIHGGKYYLCDWIISHFPANYDDLKYVETSGGAASVLLNKKPSSKGEVYNDLNPKVANIFHCLKHYPDCFSEAIKKIDYSEKSFKDAAKVEFQYNNTEAALAELVLRRMSRGGLGKHFSWSQRERGGRPGDLNAWETFKDLVPLIATRLQGVDVINQEQVEVVKAHDSPDTLFYCDPPYVHATRSVPKAYDYELNDEQHREFAKALNAAKGKVVISGYDCKLYQELYKGWRVVCKSVKNNAGQGKTKSNRIECLWLNY
jgi:DNA adenine methylase